MPLAFPTRAALLCLFGGTSLLRAADPGAPASFAEFDRRATAGERLVVCFFGASLTWGANATDPNRTSYRALVGARLATRYPEARFTFVDAAIGGTGSQLGAFRLERDVLRHGPALVFLDFSANDGLEAATPESMASYEAILRRILQEAKAPVVQVIFPFRGQVDPGKDIARYQRRLAHIALSKAYGTALGDAVALARDRLTAGTTTLSELWPFDGVHPSDEGYALFADAAWNGLLEAIGEGRICVLPPTRLHGGDYAHVVRVPIRGTDGGVPEGWSAVRPSVQSACHDMLMSRWLDGVTAAALPPETTADAPFPAPLVATFRGSSLHLWGESTPQSGRFRVWIDGRALRRPNAKDDDAAGEVFDAGLLGRRMGGTAHLSLELARGLDPSLPHALRLEPLRPAGAPAQELRFESLCVAGPSAAELHFSNPQ